MHLVHIGRAPAYLSDIVTATTGPAEEPPVQPAPVSNLLSSRGRLRSSNTFRYELPFLKCKFGERSFSYAGPKAWNDLPFALQELTDRVLSKGNWKLICLHWHILTVVHNFVEAPLVTLGVNGVWNNDNVM